MGEGITRTDLDAWGDRFKDDFKDLLRAETRSIHSKVDGIYNQRYEDRETQKAICDSHNKRMEIIEVRLGTWLTFRQRLIGAWTAAKWSASIGTPIFGVIWAGLKWYASHKAQGGHP